MKLTRIPELWNARWFAQVWDQLLGDSSTVAGHLASTDPHPDLIDSMSAASSAALTDKLLISQSSTLRSATVTQVLQPHRDETDPHPDLIDDLATATSVAETDLLFVSQAGTNRRATVDQLAAAVFGLEWDDLTTEAYGINLPGASADPGRDTATGMLNFSGTVDNVIAGSWQMSHQWAGSTLAPIVRPHLHLMFPNSVSADTRWKFEANIGSPNADFDHTYGSYTTIATITVANPENVKRHVLAGFGDLGLTGRAASTVIMWRISRLANSDGADTQTTTCSLVSLDLHYQKSRAGTETEYS